VKRPGFGDMPDSSRGKPDVGREHCHLERYKKRSHIKYGWPGIRQIQQARYGP
jgi:hypothetical protein